MGEGPERDQLVGDARALRRNLTSDERQFPQDVVELQAFLAGDERLGIRAVPAAEIAFVDELAGAQFVVRNPNAASSCGCGVSFSV